MKKKWEEEDAKEKEDEENAQEKKKKEKEKEKKEKANMKEPLLSSKTPPSYTKASSVQALLGTPKASSPPSHTKTSSVSVLPSTPKASSVPARPPPTSPPSSPPSPSLKGGGRQPDLEKGQSKKAIPTSPTPKKEKSVSTGEENREGGCVIS